VRRELQGPLFAGGMSGRDPAWTPWCGVPSGPRRVTQTRNCAQSRVGDPAARAWHDGCVDGHFTGLGERWAW